MSVKPVLCLVVALLAAGCGSTVPLQRNGAPESGLAMPSSAPQIGRGQAPGPGSSSGLTTSAGQSQLQASTHSRSAPGAANPAGAQAGPGQVVGSSAPIRIGLMYSSDANSVVASFGGAFSEPDYRAIQNAVVSYINGSGGVAGHRLVPEYYNASQTKSAQQISDEACASWVQDDHVLAAMPGLAIIDTSVLSHCLDAARVLTVYEGSYSTLDAQSFARLPYWFEPDTLSLNTLATVYAHALAAEGFFKDARIGLIYDSYPQFTSVAENVLIPAIRAAGGNVVSTFQQGIHSTSDVASGSSQMNSAVLRFRAARVSKVMFFDAWVGGWIEFAIAAQDQSWHPTYGLSSQDGPQDALSTGLIPSGQLPGTVFAGWYTVDDVPPEVAGNWARRAECLDVFRKAHINVTNLSTDGYGAAMSMCSGLLVLQDAGHLAGGTLTSSSLARAVSALGSHLQSATVPATHFAPGRQFGVAGWRPGSYQQSCGCFRYTGPIHTF